MVNAITKGINVSVEVTYEPQFSNPIQHHFVFTYKVTIENKSSATVQLMRRKWEIYDATESLKVIEGSGVVGQQPVLESNQIHSYVSGCNLKSGMGKMKGIFYMEKLSDGKIIEVIIPEFHMIASLFHN